MIVSHYICSVIKNKMKNAIDMKAFKKYFSGQSSGKGTLISYGRGPEGEEVMIDITEPKHINLK